MTQNPFDDALGGGGFDMNALLQQAQAMQEQLQSAQQRLADTIVDGSTAGGAVTVRVNGIGELVAVEITPDAVGGDAGGVDADDLAALGDMVVAAYRDAKVRADALASETLGPLAGGAGEGGLPGVPGKLGF